MYTCHKCGRRIKHWEQQLAPGAQMPDLGEVLLDALAASGIGTLAELRAASDAELLSVTGIGPARLQLIKEKLMEADNDSSQ